MTRPATIRSQRRPHSLMAVMIFGIVYLSAVALVVSPRSVLGASPAALSGHVGLVRAVDAAP